MTVDEIKQTYSMREIVERYGIQVKRDGMCSCPFHGADKHASMKIYKDSFHCFACGANGDIFTFIQKMDNCDFKTAFYSLGGEYGNDHRQAKIAKYRAEKAREKQELKKQKIRDRIERNNTLIHATRELSKRCEPLSDDWCFYYNMYCMALIEDEYLREEEEKSETT